MPPAAFNGGTEGLQGGGMGLSGPFPNPLPCKAGGQQEGKGLPAAASLVAPLPGFLWDTQPPRSLEGTWRLLF